MIYYIAHWDWILKNSRAEIAKKVDFNITGISPIIDYKDELEVAFSSNINWEYKRQKLIHLMGILRLRRLIKNFKEKDILHIFTLKSLIIYLISSIFTNKKYTVIASVTGLGYLFANTKFANFLLLGKSEEGEIDLLSAKKAMDESWKLADAGIEIKELRNSNEWSIRTRQLFLSEGLVAKGRGLDSKASGVLTYLVNAIEKKFEGNGSSLIPYSMMSAVEPGKVEFLGDKWRDDEIALNQWATNDLNATLGDKIKVSYYTVGERRKLIESSKEFILKKILCIIK